MNPLNIRSHSLLIQWVEEDPESRSQVSMLSSVSCRGGGSGEGSPEASRLFPSTDCACEPFRVWELDSGKLLNLFLVG